MAAPTVFRSSDSGAPVLTGAVGTARDILDACLVNGYGGTFATNTLTSSGVAPSDGDTVTVDGNTYTFKTALTPSAGQVLIGTAAASLTNLVAAMMGHGASGTNYAAGTPQCDTIVVTALSATVITMQARVAGSAGNAKTLARSAVTLTVGGANFAGGTDAVNKVGLGWTKSFSGTQGGVYRQLAGKQFYLWVNDAGPGAGLGKEFRLDGAEVYSTAYSATLLANMTSPFPTAASRAAGLFGRKSATLDATARPWMLIGDDRTFYLFMQSGDTAGAYTQVGFGDYYSLLPSDSYNCAIWGRITENSGANQDSFTASVSTTWNVIANGEVARAYTGTGGSQHAQTQGDTAAANQLAYPNPIDGCVYASRIYISPSLAGTLTASRHGYFRGLYQFCHAASNVTDGDTFISSSGEFSGKSFIIVKANQTGTTMLLETTAWDISV